MFINKFYEGKPSKFKSLNDLKKRLNFIRYIFVNNRHLENIRIYVYKIACKKEGAKNDEISPVIFHTQFYMQNTFVF